MKGAYTATIGFLVHMNLSCMMLRTNLYIILKEDWALKGIDKKIQELHKDCLW